MIEWFREDDSTSIQTAFYAGLLVISGALFWRLKDRVGVWASALFLWSGVSLVHVCLFRWSPYQFDLNRYYLFSHSSLKDGVFLLAIAALGLCYRPSPWVPIVLGLLNSIPLLIWRCGAFYSDSMDAAFIACTLPFFFVREDRWRWSVIIPVLAIVRSGSVTAYLAMGISWLIVNRSWRFTAALLLSCAAGTGTIHHSIFHTNGRIDHWKRALTYFFEHDSFWLGFGTGTFSAHAEAFWPEQRWLWGHNEFLQVFMEQGALGLALLVATVAVVLWNARKCRVTLASSAAYLCSMLALNPFRYLASAYLGMILLQISHARGYEQSR